MKQKSTLTVCITRGDRCFNLVKNIKVSAKSINDAKKQILKEYQESGCAVDFAAEFRIDGVLSNPFVDSKKRVPPMVASENPLAELQDAVQAAKSISAMIPRNPEMKHAAYLAAAVGAWQHAAGVAFHLAKQAEEKKNAAQLKFKPKNKAQRLEASNVITLVLDQSNIEEIGGWVDVMGLKAKFGPEIALQSLLSKKSALVVMCEPGYDGWVRRRIEIE